MVDAPLSKVVSAPTVKVPQLVAVNGSVVENHVDNYPHASLVGLVDKLSHVLRFAVRAMESQELRRGGERRQGGQTWCIG